MSKAPKPNTTDRQRKKEKRGKTTMLNTIDRRKAYYIVLDTEACNTNVDDMKSSLVYDLGYAIIDKKGNVYKTRNLVIRDIYKDEEELMKTAYYADKLPQYEEELLNGVRTMTTLAKARKLLKSDCEEYNVKAIIAHNAGFDCRALNTTLRYLTGSKVRYFYPYGMALWDSLKMANDTICKQKTYKKFCLANGYMTNHKTPRVKATAEVLYRYITGNNTFIEKHTGLEDVMIEKEIFVKCLAQHKKMRKELFKA